MTKNIFSFIHSSRIKTSLVDRLAYAGDAGFYELIPQAVVQPNSIDEIIQLFHWSNRTGTPLCFRAGGTSLSGQSITDGVLVDIGKHWRAIEPLDNGKLVKVQPGIIASMVNHFLLRYGTKIGPDPSSIHAAMMGGILSNNSSGMCCGVAYNAYHTLKSIQFILPNGHVYNTDREEDYHRFVNQEKEICITLSKFRQQIFDSNTLLQKIRTKYQTKNTVGYGLNALVDYEHPLDIFSHLLIGAEGTLAFIAEAVLQTIPIQPHTSTALLYFNTISDACNAILPLKESGADVLELMDRASLRSVEDLKGLPPFFKELPESAACLLCEYAAPSQLELEELLKKAANYIAELQLLHPADFTTNSEQRQFYWKIRKGMFPSVGAVRARGTTVILEDIAFPLEHLANAVIDLQQLFRDFNYENAIIFGHAKDGNLHFVITQLLDTPQEIDRYNRFIQSLVKLVVNKYNGTLKAEHGTGRNMAPFVEAEWGGELYTMMKAIKQVVDPKNLLNPGVIINEHADAHIRNLKQMPVVEEEVDKCIECGYCEPLCPSKDITLSPRQRIQIRRQLKKLEQTGQKAAYKKLLAEYEYAGLDTCATDGLCQSECPVSINTGDLVKRLRQENHSKFGNSMALTIARNYKLVEQLTRQTIQLASFINGLGGLNIITRITKGLNKIFPGTPVWWNEIKPAKSLPQSNPNQPSALYFSACIHRMLGDGGESLQEKMIRVCERAGVSILFPKDIRGHCCGQAFSSKGYQDAAVVMEEKTIDAILAWTNNGALPVVCDFTSCTYTFLKQSAHLSADYRKKWNKITWIDSIEFFKNKIIPKLPITSKKEVIALHPTCASTKMGLSNAMKQVASACAKEVLVPAYAGCCGMAGDRGFWVPEMTESATHMEIKHLGECQGYYSTAGTCEMNLTHFSGKEFQHLVQLLDEVSS